MVNLVTQTRDALLIKAKLLQNQQKTLISNLILVSWANCLELLSKNDFHQRRCRYANKRLGFLFWKSVANVAAYTFETSSKGANENKLTESFHLLTSCRIDFCKDNLIGCIEQQKPFILTYATSSQWKTNFEEIL